MDKDKQIVITDNENKSNNFEDKSNKQIEEMANDIAKICPDLVENCCGQINCVTHLTLSLSKMGYRKASEVAREIFEEIEKIIDNHYNKHIFGSYLEDTEKEAVMDFSGDVTYDIAELKKKYTEVGRITYELYKNNQLLLGGANDG